MDQSIAESDPLASLTTATDSFFREVNDLRLHVVAAGEDDAPLVLLLHGFPEYWYCWVDYIDPLVEAGYQILIPDQRGYNLSDKPDRISSYRNSHLSIDIAELVKSTGNESAHVIGHDWGAAVAWDLALRFPERLDRLGIINVPHPDVFKQELTSNLSQIRKSWYLFFFQLPRVPECFARKNNFQNLIEAMQTGESKILTDADLRRYRTAWSQEGAITGMINWYRALFRHSDTLPKLQIEHPTLVIWGEEDRYLSPEMAPKSMEYCLNGRLERFPEGSHWIHHEKPEKVANLLIDHLRDQAVSERQSGSFRSC